MQRQDIQEKDEIISQITKVLSEDFKLLKLDSNLRNSLLNVILTPRLSSPRPVEELNKKLDEIMPYIKLLNLETLNKLENIIQYRTIDVDSRGNQVLQLRKLSVLISNNEFLLDSQVKRLFDKIRDYNKSRVEKINPQNWIDEITKDEYKDKLKLSTSSKLKTAEGENPKQDAKNKLNEVIKKINKELKQGTDKSEHFLTQYERLTNELKSALINFGVVSQTMQKRGTSDTAEAVINILNAMGENGAQLVNIKNINKEKSVQPDQKRKSSLFSSFNPVALFGQSKSEQREEKKSSVSVQTKKEARDPNPEFTKLKLGFAEMTQKLRELSAFGEYKDLTCYSEKDQWVVFTTEHSNRENENWSVILFNAEKFTEEFNLHILRNAKINSTTLSELQTRFGDIQKDFNQIYDYFIEYKNAREKRLQNNSDLLSKEVIILAKMLDKIDTSWLSEKRAHHQHLLKRLVEERLIMHDKSNTSVLQALRNKIDSAKKFINEYTKEIQLAKLNWKARIVRDLEYVETNGSHLSFSEKKKIILDLKNLEIRHDEEALSKIENQISGSEKMPVLEYVEHFPNVTDSEPEAEQEVVEENKKSGPTYA